MSETTLMNAPEARTPAGEIKPQTSTAPTTVIEEIPKPQTASTEGEKPADTPTKDEPPKETTLLNEKTKPVELTGSPEKYEDFKAPDGYEFRPETMDGARTLFKELNLSQAGAQRLVDFHAAELKAVLEAPQKQWEETKAKWVEEVKSLPGIGDRLDQVKATVSRAIDGLGDAKLASDFRQAMDFTGAGNNPAFIRAFYMLAQKVTEGKSVTGGGPVEVKAPNAPPGDIAHRMYPNLK